MAVAAVAVSVAAAAEVVLLLAYWLRPLPALEVHLRYWAPGLAWLGPS